MDKSEVFKQWKAHISKIPYGRIYHRICEEDMRLGEYPKVEIRKCKYSCTGVGALYSNNQTFPLTRTYDSGDLLYCETDIDGAKKFLEEDMGQKSWDEYESSHFVGSEANENRTILWQAYQKLREEFQMYSASLSFADVRINNIGDFTICGYIDCSYAPIYAKVKKNQKEKEILIGYLKKGDEGTESVIFNEIPLPLWMKIGLIVATAAMIIAALFA